jgi:hypothetical protein
MTTLLLLSALMLSGSPAAAFAPTPGLLAKVKVEALRQRVQELETRLRDSDAGLRDADAVVAEHAEEARALFSRKCHADAGSMRHWVHMLAYSDSGLVQDSPNWKSLMSRCEPGMGRFNGSSDRAAQEIARYLQTAVAYQNRIDEILRARIGMGDALAKAREDLAAAAREAAAL